MHDIRTTSLEAYNQLIASGKDSTQRAQILACLLRQPQGLTRAEISEETGLRLASVCGRVKELRDTGLIIESGYRRCRLTQRRAFLLFPVQEES